MSDKKLEGEQDFKGVASIIIADNKKKDQIIAVAKEALEKIEDPRKRDHKEPDSYTQLGCVMHIAYEALAEIARLEQGEK